MDLDAPNLLKTVCKPVTVPTNTNPNDQPAPSLTFDGRFAIATSQDANYLERCGTHLHEFLTNDSGSYTYPSCWSGACPPPFSAHAVIWQTDASSSNPKRQRRLSGIFLPSRRRFTIPSAPPSAGH